MCQWQLRLVQLRLIHQEPQGTSHQRNEQGTTQGQFDCLSVTMYRCSYVVQLNVNPSKYMCILNCLIFADFVLGL